MPSKSKVNSTHFFSSWMIKKMLQKFLQRSLVFFISFFLFLPAWGIAQTVDTSIRIDISNIRNLIGDVGCLLFNAPEGYPSNHEKAYKIIHSPISSGGAVCEFKEIASGLYAVIVFHDENLNAHMDKNFMGIPKEGYGASNNIRPLMSAPAFSDASFMAPKGNATKLKIQMGY